MVEEKTRKCEMCGVHDMQYIFGSEDKQLSLYACPNCDSPTGKMPGKLDLE